MKAAEKKRKKLILGKMDSKKGLFHINQKINLETK